jgi:hypothetical protein
MSKLWIIGDSFTGSNDIKNGAPPSWTQIICEKFKGEKYYVSSKGSRDFQTILDIFLRNLKDIKNDDFVIMVIPALSRMRLPLEIPSMDVEISNEYFLSRDKEKHLDYFIGAMSYTKDSESKRLESPLTNISEDMVHDENNLGYVINASNASKFNYIEIIKSIKAYLPFEIFIWSWENEILSEVVENKDKIKKEIGFWHTLYDLWKETEGQEGVQGDHHFSSKMHKAFADYLIVKFPQFFNV